MGFFSEQVRNISRDGKKEEAQMKIMNCKDLKAENLTVLIYGVPGMGKTTLLGKQEGRTLIIDASVLTWNESVDVVRISENVGEMGTIMKELQSQYEYDIVCVDSLSELERAMLAYFGRTGNNKGVPSLQDYQRVDCYIID